MSVLKDIWNSLLPGKTPNPLDSYTLQLLTNNAVYPLQDEETWLNAYTGNNIVFTVINKITEPAATVPIFQYDARGEIVEDGKMIAKLNKPNGYQSRSQLIEAALTYYYIFGNSYTAAETLDNGLNAGIPQRLDVLPSHKISIKIGTVFNPIAGYAFYPMGLHATFNSVDQKFDYPKEKIFHWKEFNPDFQFNGSHLKGMSRLKPLLKSIVGADEAYNSLVKTFQAQGMWGILTMLDEEGKAVSMDKEQKSQLKRKFKSDSQKGDITLSNFKAEYTKMGLNPKEMMVIQALDMFAGRVCDTFNVPNIIMSVGAKTQTYLNYQEAERGLWTKAICPSLDAYLEGLSEWLAPLFKEDGNILRADYSGVEALQVNVQQTVSWMTAAGAFTKNEIREACGFESLPDPFMDLVYAPIGQMPIDQISQPPDPGLVEGAMKALKLSDYRKKVNAN